MKLDQDISTQTAEALGKIDAAANLEAETGLLGSVMIDAGTIRQILDFGIRPEHFSSQAHAEFFRAAMNLELAGEPVDPVTMLEAVNPPEGIDRDQLRKFAGEVMTMTPTAANWRQYAGIVLESFKRQQLRLVIAKQWEALKNGSTAADTLGALQAGMDQLAGGIAGAGMMNSAEVFGGLLDRLVEIAEGKKDPSCRTGFKALDNILPGGLPAGGFTILAARPGVGKSAFAIEIARNVIDRGGTVLFFSLEMTSDQVSSRMIAAKTRIPYSKILQSKPKLSDKEWEEVSCADAFYGNTNRFFFREQPSAVDDILLQARLHPGADLIVVDYTQLLEKNAKVSNWEAITEVSRSLKRAAKTLGKPILALSQVNREGANSGNKYTGNKAPGLEQLSQSDALGQDADAVIVMYRVEEVVETDVRTAQLSAEFMASATQEEKAKDAAAKQSQKTGPALIALKIVKNRHGRAGTEIGYDYYPATNIFSNEITAE